jgi:DNA-binding NarL/FixJ family response regulator
VQPKFDMVRPNAALTPGAHSSNMELRKLASVLLLWRSRSTHSPSRPLASSTSFMGEFLVTEQQPSARILIADDHQLLADACKSLLEPEFQVVGVVTDGRRLIAAADEIKPDIIILDIYMPHLNGLDAASQVKQKLPGVKLVFLTMTMAAGVAAEAFRRGASAYVLKHSAGSELLLAIRKVNQGASYLSPLVAKETVSFLLSQEDNASQERRITKRQSEILQLLAEGKSMKEVASVINIKPATVAFHKYRMMEMLNIKTNAGLLEYAIKHQMTAP